MSKLKKKFILEIKERLKSHIRYTINEKKLKIILKDEKRLGLRLCANNIIKCPCDDLEMMLYKYSECNGELIKLL